MNDAEMLEAVCAMAFADSALTVEELQVLGKLATAAGVANADLHDAIERAGRDADVLEDQTDRVMRDPEATLRRVIAVAHTSGSLDEGHGAMVLWRVATKLGVGADRFNELLTTLRSS